MSSIVENNAMLTPVRDVPPRHEAPLPYLWTLGGPHLAIRDLGAILRSEGNLGSSSIVADLAISTFQHMLDV